MPNKQYRAQENGSWKYEYWLENESERNSNAHFYTYTQNLPEEIDYIITKPSCSQEEEGISNIRKKLMNLYRTVRTSTLQTCTEE
jgi:hypothetical protein